jgi:hypothetical protein
MSKVPKWSNMAYIVLKDGEATFSCFDLINAAKVSAELNRLEAENAELRQRLNTPRTDADGLLQRASFLVGNPGTNISSSTDIACDEWQADYEKYIAQFRTTQTATEGDEG